MENGSDSPPHLADRSVLARAAGVLAPVALLFFLGVAWNRGTSAFARVESHAAALLAAARESGIEPALLAGLVYVESGGRERARSSAGAVGLGQLKPAAAGEARAWISRRGAGEAPPPGEDLDDPGANARLAAAYLALLLERFGDEDLALAAYAAGPGAIQARLLEAGSDRGALRERLRAEAGGPGEYVRRVRSFAERFRERGFGAADRG